MRNLFTSESVTEGHPDKICDQIADAILDAIIAEDPYARVACEVTCTTGIVSIMGEISTTCYADIPKIARSVVKEIGYTCDGFNGDSCAICTMIDEQSADIALGVDKALEYKNGVLDDGLSNGAGDQGLMFGFACDETTELMPLPISLAHKLAKRLTEVRKNGTLPYLKPDGKTQVTIEYIDGAPRSVDTIVVSSQHSAYIDLVKLREDIINEVINKVVPSKLLNKDTKIFINPTGRFIIGGPQGDSGLTGRKIIVDTYGGYARHGGGSFSGKDPTKVDRSATYAARYVAKNIVAAGLAKKCEVQLAYAIGVAQPVSISVDTFSTGVVSDEKISLAVKKLFDLRPSAIIKNLDLRKPIYKAISNYGHMGREDVGAKWELTDKADALRQELGV